MNDIQTMTTVERAALRLRMRETIGINDDIHPKINPPNREIAEHLIRAIDVYGVQFEEPENRAVQPNGSLFKTRSRKYSAHRSVLQDWTNSLSFMMQSVLITACRGPDGIRKDHQVKVLIRYLRRCFLICAFDGKVRWSPYEPGGGSFTGPLKLDGLGPNDGHLDKFIEIYLRHVDELPHHFQLHLMHAAEILGYKHPDNDVREFWRAFYLAIVDDAHLLPEPEQKMDSRLGDSEANWRAAEGVIAEGSGTLASIPESEVRRLVGGLLAPSSEDHAKTKHSPSQDAVIETNRIIAEHPESDAARLSWLAKDITRLEDVRGYLKYNERASIRDAIDRLRLAAPDFLPLPSNR